MTTYLYDPKAAARCPAAYQGSPVAYFPAKKGCCDSCAHDDGPCATGAVEGTKGYVNLVVIVAGLGLGLWLTSKRK